MAEERPGGPLSERDLDLLSAYLDDELSDVERVRLEQRLRDDVALQVELDALRQTVELVRALPQVAVPRNFTLDPATYGRPSRPPLLRLATPMIASGVSLVLVGVCAGALVLGGGLAVPATLPLARDAQSVAEEAPAAAEPLEQPAEEEAEEELALENGAVEVEEEPAAEPEALEEPAIEEDVAGEATDGEFAAPPTGAEEAQEAPESGTGGGVAEGEALEEEVAESEAEALPAEESAPEPEQEGGADRSTTLSTGTPAPTALGQVAQPTEIAEQVAPAEAPAPDALDEAEPAASEFRDDDVESFAERDSFQQPFFLIGLAIGGAIVLGVLLIAGGAGIALSTRRR